MTAPCDHQIPALRVLAVTRKPDSPSFEQRIAAYIDPLSMQNIHIDCEVLPTSTRGQGAMIDRCGQYDGVWWQRHLLLPWRVPRLRRAAKRLVFDFDDPMIYSARAGGHASFARRVRFAVLLRRCDATTAASNHLADLARPYCAHANIVPMAVDPPVESVPVSDRPGPAQLLWLGSSATQSYLDLIRPVLEQIGSARRDITLRIVGHVPLTFGDMKVDFRRWSLEEQDLALRQCHIGLCPMPDTVWTRGKCPYKVLQYMAHAMPWVGNAVGENLVTAGNDPSPRGFCVQNADGWRSCLSRLLEDQSLAAAMGIRGRKYVQEKHNRAILTRQLAEILRGPEAR